MGAYCRLYDSTFHAKVQCCTFHAYLFIAVERVCAYRKFNIELQSHVQA